MIRIVFALLFFICAIVCFIFAALREDERYPAVRFYVPGYLALVVAVGLAASLLFWRP